MRSITNQLRDAARSLRRTPGFTAWVVLLLALTVGANALLFTVVQAVVLRPLPFAEPERLAWVWSTRTDRDHAFFSIPDYMDFRDQNRTVENFAVFTAWGGNTLGPGGPERWPGMMTTANTFELLGVQPALGRLLQSRDGQPGHGDAMVITYGMWQRRFGGRPDALGQKFTLSGRALTIVGVLPRNFLFPGAGPDMEFVIPLMLDSDPRREDRATSNFLRGFARLKPGVTAQQAYDDFAAINERLKAMYPDANAKKTPPRFFPLHTEVLGDFRPALLALLASVGLLALLAAINLANLLHVRALAREKEFAVRMALGAQPRELARMLLFESLLLAFAGGAAGVALGWLSLGRLLRMAPAELPRAAEVEFGAAAVAFAAVLALVMGLVMGAIPAWRAGQALSRGALNSESRGASSSRSRRRGLETLVLTEVAIATVLLIGTGLFLKSFVQLQSVSPGFTAENVLMLRPSLPARYGDPVALQAFAEVMQRELEGIPGVESAALVSAIPMGQFNNRMDFEIAGRPPATKEEILTAQNRQASPRYFRTMQIPILDGREFTEADSADAERVVIIDAALARQYFPGQSPVGKHLIIDKRPNLIVGVAGEVKHFGLDDPPYTTLYQPVAQIGKTQAGFFAGRPHFVMRTRVEPMTLAEEARRRLARVDPTLPVARLRSMDDYLETWLAPRRFNLQLLGAFGAFAIVFAGLGTYAVLATAARQRTQEIGVRVALGATRANILQLILGRSLLICGAGIVMGSLAARAASQPVRGLLFQVQPFDAAILGGVALLMLLVGLAASALPAWRASRTDPMTALRS